MVLCSPLFPFGKQRFSGSECVGVYDQISCWLVGGDGGLAAMLAGASGLSMVCSSCRQDILLVSTVPKKLLFFLKGGNKNESKEPYSSE
jgi:hypothetical protein